MPGGIYLLPIKSKEDKVIFNNRASLTLSLPNNNSYIAVIALPLDSKPGKKTITINSSSNSYSHDFTIQHKGYAVEHLTIKDNNKVSPHKSVHNRIAQEYKEIQKTYSYWHEKNLTDLKLIQPVKGRLSSSFGRVRILNGIKKSPHSGLDIAAPVGTKVHAARAGKVIHIADYFYLGKTIFIHHGQSFITSYSHLHKIDVYPGDEVAVGQIIGEVGATGRATGPHLHWSVSINNVRIDPELFIN